MKTPEWPLWGFRFVLTYRIYSLLPINIIPQTTDNYKTRFIRINTRLSLRKRCLSRCQSCDRYAEWGTGYIIQSNLMAEFHGCRVSAVLAADTYVHVRTYTLA